MNTCDYSQLMNDILNLKIVSSNELFKLPTQEEIDKDMNEYITEEENINNELDYKTFIESIEKRVEEGDYICNWEKQEYNNYIQGIVNEGRKFTSLGEGQAIQHKNPRYHYVNYISNVQLRSKNNIPLIDNIKCFRCNTIKNNSIMNHPKTGLEIVDLGGYEDMELNHIISDFDEGVYELLPYQSFNIYGCSFVKTCFNTIGKDYEYVCPFIDYDLETSESNDINVEINKLVSLINLFINKVIPGIPSYSISAVGYSNVLANDYYTVLNNNSNPISYIKLQSKPQSHKFLSVHIVFYNIKIHCIELKERIFNTLKDFKEFKGFDKAPYCSGSLRHIGSVKSGLVDTTEASSKRVDNLTNTEILDQFITYYNSKIQYSIIPLNNLNNHNKIIEDNKLDVLNRQFKDLKITITFGNQLINPLIIEPFIKYMLDNYTTESDLSYSNRWKLISYYIMYKKYFNSPITPENILQVFPGHSSIQTQIDFLQSVIKTNNPKPLLNYLKTISINNDVSPMDYKIVDNSNSLYAMTSHFGQHKVEDLRHAKNLKDIIEIITGSFAISSDGNYHYFTNDGVEQYNINGRPNSYVAKFYPSKLTILINDELRYKIENPDEIKTTDDENTELLSTLFKKKFDEDKTKHKNKDILLNAHTFITLLYKYFDIYREDGMTNFKLNGYNTETVKSEVYDDVCKIIKLFEDRLVEGCFTLDESNNIIDNTLQEFLRSIKYLLVRHEKPEKAFLAIDSFGATGKSLFFSKIIKDLFGPSGLNDDALNCVDSAFSDKYRFLYTVFNEVAKGKIDKDKITSILKQLTDSNITSARVKNVQNAKTFKNNGIYVLLSNSEDCNGALDYYDEALMGRYVLIEFKPFVKDGQVDTLAGGNYYSLIDKYKKYNDANYIYSYDFRNALFKYIMNLDITTRTKGRAQPNKYKTEKYQELAKQDIEEIKSNNTKLTLSICIDKLFSVDLDTKTLFKYSTDSKYVGFKINDLTNNKELQKKIKQVLNYKSAFDRRMRYKLSDELANNFSNNKFNLIICENDKFKDIITITEPEPNLI